MALLCGIGPICLQYRTVSVREVELIAVLLRFSAKHPFGQFSFRFLENYLDAIMNGRDPSGMCRARQTPEPLDVSLLSTEIVGLDSGSYALPESGIVVQLA
jgi:hypothetical protein